MKQYITVEQAEMELGKHYLEMIDWIEEHGYRDWSVKGYKADRPFLSIGQMIEFLSEKGEFKIMQSNNSSIIIRNKKTYSKTNEYNTALCDILWEVVKEVLDNH